MGAATGGIVAAAAGTGSPLDVRSGDTVTLDGDRLTMLAVEPDGARVRDASGEEHNVCCDDCDRLGCTYCVDCT